MLLTLLNTIIQLIFMIALAPLLNGLIKKIKAFSQKRKGPSIFQFYRDLLKLLKKDCVISTTTSWIFKITPYVVLISSLTVAILIPLSSHIDHPFFTGDLIFVVYLLAMGRFFISLSALDSGGTFGGMGSSRESMLSILFEPSLLISLFTLCLISGNISLQSAFLTTIQPGFMPLQPVYLLIFISIFIVMIAETSRLPVDDPATHLELTMVHEAMVLEYSGKNLAMLELASSIKQLIFIVILANLFIPTDALTLGLGFPLAVILSLLLFLIKVTLITFVLATVEVFTVKFRLFSVPNLATLSFILAFLGFVQRFLIGG
jgi:formate hydrogenlyase subunit 4